MFGSWSSVLVNTEQRQDKIVKRIFALSLYRTPHSFPSENIPLRSEEMLPVVGDVGEDSSETPHVSRGGDVSVVSSQNLGSQVADCTTELGGAVVHRGGGLA